MYTPLHVHTEYSILDGIVNISAYVKKMIDYNITAGAVTEHGNLGSTIKFYTECRKAGIKPIIGIEAYVVDDVNLKEREMYHLVLLAKNEEGYRNLLKLNNLSFKYFYYKPRIDYNILKNYSNGLICMSACLAGHIPSLLLQEQYEKARYYVDLLLEIFKDDFYLEIQDNELPEQVIVNSLIISLAKEKGIPVVATSDIHYLNPEDKEAHLIALAVQTKKTLQHILNSKDFSGFVNSNSFCLKPYDIFKQKIQLSEAVDNTNLIAQKCNLVIPELEESKPLFPNIELPYNITPEQQLIKLTKKALLKLEIPDYETYYKRLNYELEVINRQGFAPYFLVLKDIVEFCRSNNIRYGLGRGSASGSLVSYLLRITQIDPIKHGLLFERFLTPDRVSLPDIDLDIEEVRRNEVIQYLYDKYGIDKVCHIGTYGTLSLKAVIKDVARTLDIEFDVINNITKNMPDDIDINTIETNEIFNEISKTLGAEKAQKIINMSKILYGLKRHPSIHAAGIVLSPIPIDNIVPIRIQDNEIVTQWEMEEIEQIGLIKFDLLGLRTLSVVEECIKMCNVDIDKISFDDEKTWQLIRAGNTIGCFQFESPGIRKLLRDMQASTFDDLVAANALS